VGNLGGCRADDLSWHSYPHSLTLTLPPLGIVVFKHEAETTSRA
jgi:1,4-alpha-glucan branching enzyme